MSTRERRADVHHGNTPAAWVVVVITTLAFIVGTLAVIAANWTMFWAAVALVIIGAIVGKALQAAGLGAYARR